MKIVIDIPEEVYKHLTEYQLLPSDFDADWAIIHGTPLPNGSIGDLDEILIWLINNGIVSELKCGELAEIFEGATIIPADESEVKG